jgi:hypothetical protein
VTPGNVDPRSFTSREGGRKALTRNKCKYTKSFNKCSKMLLECCPDKMPADIIHNICFLAKLIEDDFFGKFMVSDTSLRYNLGLNNFVLMETGPV